ncbi:hypothetical protein Tco_0268891 [Tanacetum coccineum]
MSDQLAEEKNTVKIKQTTILELKECLRKKDSENEHLKSKIVDFTTVQNLQVQVEELKSVNESLNSSVEELSKARALVEATLRERDEMIDAQLSSSMQKEYNDLLASNDILKQRLETKFKFSKHDTFLEKMIEMIEKEYESNVSKISITSSTFETKNLELVKEMGDKVKCFDEEKTAFETKISKLEKVFDDVKIELSKRTNLRCILQILKKKMHY